MMEENGSHADAFAVNRMSDHYIEFRDVTKWFGEHCVLDRVSFFVDPGETCVIMGRSGVGKSVALKHIMGFLKPDAGRIIVATAPGPVVADPAILPFRHLRPNLRLRPGAN